MTRVAVFPILGPEIGVVAWEYEQGDVRRYGAVGDGASNDRAAIANADSSVAAIGKGAVYFPPGFLCLVGGSDLAIASACVFDTRARVKPGRGVTVTFNGPVSTLDAQHFDLTAGGAIQPRSSFRRFLTSYGDAFDVFTLGESGRTHPIQGEFDFLFGEKDKHLRRFEWNMSGPRVLSAPVYSGTISTIQRQRRTFSVSGAPFGSNAFRRTRDTSHVVRFTSGSAADRRQNPYRFITEHTASQITLGLQTAVDFAVGDTFEIRSLSLGSGAKQPAMMLWHQERDDGAPGSEKIALRLGESESNTGLEISFSRYGSAAIGLPGPHARKLIDVIPLGTRGGGGGALDGVFDVAFLEDSSMYRDAIFNMPNRPNALRWYRDSRQWAFSAGIRCETRRITTTATCADTDHIVLCDVSRGGYEFFLPAAEAAPNRVLVIKKDDGSSNTLTVRTRGGRIDGATSLALSEPWASAQFVSHGGSWHRLA